MLSFKLLNEQNAEKIINSFSGCDRDYLCEIVESFLDDDAEIALSFADGCLLVRIFDGEYSFVYPIEVCDECDALAACDKIRLYAINQEIALRFTDVPSEEMDNLSDMFLHLSIDYFDPERETYYVTALNEACRDDIPVLEFEDITLNALSPDDDVFYAALSKDCETNEFWGYDYREDNPNPKDDYFRLESEAEFERGVSMSFAVRRDGFFVGEATLYAFDYLGGCELAIRILPDFRRSGIAGRIIDGFKAQGRALGLLNIRATVMENNLRSVAMCKKYFESYTHEGNRYKFINKT